jgi:type I restriction enzyme S subunit
MELMSGYKQTEVGFIPADWETIPLGRLTASVEYGSSAKSNPTGRTPVLRMGNLQGGQIDWANLVYTDDATEITKYTLHPGDVLFNRTNTIELVGKAALFKGERDAIFAGYLIRIKVDRKLLDSRFLNYVLNTEFSKRYSAKVLSVAVGQANINGQKLRTYPVPVPPTKAEQEAIADALGDADALIGALEQLIAKKSEIKSGAMQELLTGKRRLSGFTSSKAVKHTEIGSIPEDWNLTTIGDFATKVGSGITPRGGNRNYKEYGIPFIRSQNVGWGTLMLDDLVYIDHQTHSTFEATEIRVGDVLLNITGASIGRSAVAGALLEGGNVNQHVCIIRMDLKRQCSRFISLVLLSALGQIQIDSFQAGGNREGLNFGQIRSIKIPLPPSKDEQEAIVTIISDLDAEISAVEAAIEKARRIKLGMMRELLTGRIRLV